MALARGRATLQPECAHEPALADFGRGAQDDAFFRNIATNLSGCWLQRNIEACRVGLAGGLYSAPTPPPGRRPSLESPECLEVASA